MTDPDRMTPGRRASGSRGPFRPRRNRPTLIVMTKLPQPGRVKTRLGRQIGMIDAAGWMRRQARALLREVTSPRWHLCLAVTPDGAVDAPLWPRGAERRAQGRGDLGLRMGRMLRRAGPGPVILIGSDIPDLRAAHINRALIALGRVDAVLGPARDGGYWMIGFRHPGLVPAHLFDGVRWSSPDARDDTLKTLSRLRVTLTDMLDDVDEAADLNRR